MDVHVGKMLVFSLLLRCLDPLLSVAAALSLSRPLFRSAPPSEPALRQQFDAAKRSFAGATRSDHVAMAAAYDAWERVRRGGEEDGEQGGREGGRAGGRWQGGGAVPEREVRDWCSARGLSYESLEQMQLLRRELVQALAGAGLLSGDYVHQWAARDGDRGGGHARGYLSDVMLGGGSSDPFNANASVWRVVKSAIAAGCYPNVVRVKRPPQQYVQTEHGAVPRDADPKAIRFLSRSQGRVFLHPSSVNFSAGGFESPWLVYSEASVSAIGGRAGGNKGGAKAGGVPASRQKVQLRESTMVPSLALLLLGGSVRVDVESRHVSVDNWAQFEAPGRVGLLVLEMRKRVDAVLASKLESPEAVDLAAADPTLEALAQLLGAEGGSAV